MIMGGRVKAVVARGLVVAEVAVMLGDCLPVEGVWVCGMLSVAAGPSHIAGVLWHLMHVCANRPQRSRPLGP